METTRSRQKEEDGWAKKKKLGRQMMDSRNRWAHLCRVRARRFRCSRKMETQRERAGDKLVL